MSQLRVRDIMTTQVVSLRGTDTVRDATIKFALDNVSGAPVIDDDHHLIGMLSENDVLGLILKYQDRLSVEDPDLYMLAVPMDGEISDENIREASKKITETKVSDLMSTSILTTRPDSKIIDLLRAMINMDVNRVPVLEKGVLVGIVSRSDIIFSIYKRKI